MFPNHIKLAILPSVDLFYVNKSEDGTLIITDGREKKFVEILSDKLSFSYTALAPRDMEWGRLLSNGTWTGLVGMVFREEADIAIANIAYVEQRTMYVDFSHPYQNEQLVFATKAPGYLPRTTSFLYPFTWQLWLCIFFLLIITSMSFYFILRTKYGMVKSVTMVFSHLLAKSYSVKIASQSDQFLVAFWVLGAILLSFCYTALLLSVLTVPMKEPAVRTVSELSEALKRGSFECRIIKGTTFENMFENSKIESVATVYKYIKRNQWFINHNKEAMAEYLTKPFRAGMATTTGFSLLDDNKLSMSEDGFFSVMYAVPMRKTFCCKKELNVVVRRLIESGIYEKLKHHYYFQRQLPMKLSDDPDVSAVDALSLTDLYGVFFIIFAGHVLSVTCLITEIIAHKLKRN